MLLVAATPIGNLGDATPRLVSALESVGVVAAEDTRTASRLIHALGIANRPQLIPVHDHNERQRAAEVVARAAREDVLLLSDAGMPTVSDPGFAVVTEAIAQQVAVTVLPGASAVLTALALSGLPTDRFVFEGFLPRKASDRDRALAELATERRTIVLFEAPSRLAVSLEAMARAFGPARPAAVCRELTKLHEEVRRGTLGELAEWAAAGVRGEIVVVVGGGEAPVVNAADALSEVLRRVAAGERMKTAAVEVAQAAGIPSRELYQAALAARA